MAKTIDQIKQEMIDYILALRSDIKIVDGDTQHDVAIAAPANEFYKYGLLLDFEDDTRNLDAFVQLIGDETFKNNFAVGLGFKQDGTQYTIADVNTLISTRLDAYVKDWNVTRNPGSASTGFVTVYLSDATPVSWNNAVIFTSQLGSTYAPASSVSNIIPNFSTATGQYYVTIPVVATDTGAASNAIAGSIRTMSPKPSTFNYCINDSAVNGGTDSEADLDLIDRARESWAARVNGSVGATERLAGQQTYVTDVYATDQDNEAEGVYLGSVCDVWVLFGSVDSQLVEEFIYWPGQSNNSNQEQFDFVLQNQPVIETFTPVIYLYDAATGLVESSLVLGATDSVTLVKDTNTFQGSVKAMDILRIKIALNTTTSARKMKVIYLKDNNPYKLQSVMDNLDNKMVGPSVLVKNAINTPLRVIVEIKVSFGYDVATVQAAVVSNLQIFFNGGTTSYGQQFAQKKIGEDIQHTDIGMVILRTAGVVSYDTDTFRVVNTLTADFSDPIVINSNQYATLYDVLFQFNSYNLANFTASSV